jgi:hypothetical protein
MKRHTNAFLAVGAALLLGGSALAQQTQQQTPSMMQSKPQMSMDDMMKGCREHCEQTSASVDRMVQSMDEAKRSNDPAKMRAALDEAQKPLAEMKQHMSMCMNMMGMMQKMHGSGAMMHGGMGSTMPQQQPATGGTREKGAVDITFKSEPPPKSGENTFEVTVKGSDGKPVTDADVSLNFYMAAMPSMNMPEMRNTVRLKHVKDGRYRGTGDVSMAGRWDVTVAVTKGPKQIGSRKLSVTVQ